ncbi:MAG: IS66-like element accessory protein TnpA, partial [Roseinatronobacter sp.]
FGFVPVVRSAVDRVVGAPSEAGARDRDWIEIALGEVTIRLDRATGAERIAEIVRAIGPSA